MKNRNQGFTLIELMVAMGMASIVVGVIYSAYNIQTKIYTEQDKVAEMQQNIRSAMMYMQREARMAGYNAQKASHASCNANPTAGPAIKPGIHTATATSFGFSMDLDEDDQCTSTGENVLYTLYTDGSGVTKIGRDDLTDLQARQPIAENIQNINFMYIFSPPLVGTAGAKDPTSTPSASERDDVVAVQVSILARSETPNQTKSAATSFTLPRPNAWGENTSGGVVWSFTDSFSRRLLTTTVNCRNMGLK